eukprot:8483794-Pyramimonas_sp.AAC.1
MASMALLQVVLCRSRAQPQRIAPWADAVQPVVEAVQQGALVPQGLPPEQRWHAAVREHRCFI